MAGYRFGICEWCLPPVGPDVCRLAAEAGLDGVEPDLGSPQDGVCLTGIRRPCAGFPPLSFPG